MRGMTKITKKRSKDGRQPENCSDDDHGSRTYMENGVSDSGRRDSNTTKSQAQVEREK